MDRLIDETAQVFTAQHDVAAALMWRVVVDETVQRDRASLRAYFSAVRTFGNQVAHSGQVDTRSILTSHALQLPLLRRSCESCVTQRQCAVWGLPG